MTKEEQREQTIETIANLMRTMQFALEFRVKKHPQGIKVIVDVTQEQMDSLTEKAAGKEE